MSPFKRMSPDELRIVPKKLKATMWRTLYDIPTRHPAALHMKPNFIIIGAQKCGTTSLFAYLAQHPYILAPIRKEIHFFDDQYHRGFDWYRRQFPARTLEFAYELGKGYSPLTGEATPYYLFHPQCPRRMECHIPNAKLIVLLRNPIERAFSHYLHSVRTNRETRSFFTAISQEVKVIESETQKLAADPTYRSIQHQAQSYLSRGRYAEQLESWFEYFTRDQFLFLQSEALFEDPQTEVDKVTDFLGLPRHRLQNPRAHNEKTSDSRISNSDRLHLAEYFNSYNQRLFNLLGCEFVWR